MKNKKFYPIIKTKEEYSIFSSNFSKYKVAFPKLTEQLTIKALSPNENDLTYFAHVLKEEIRKLSGTVRSSLLYARNHAEDGLSPLAHDQEALDALKSASQELKDLEKAVDFAVSQAETTRLFHSLARGIIPNIDPPLDDASDDDDNAQLVDLLD